MGILLILAIILQLKVKESKNIIFPFDLADVKQIEMYHYEGVPAAEECKIITHKEDMESLLCDLQKIKIRELKGNSESMTGGSAIRFEFLLEDNSVYKLESFNAGVYQILSLPEENQKYTTSANLEKYWNQFSYEVVENQEEELDFLTIDEYNETYAAKKSPMEEAFIESLHIICDTQTFPDGVNYGYDGVYDISENSFVVEDIDGDDKKELIISYWTTSLAGNVLKIYGYDEENDQLVEEFSEYPGATFYDNGIVEVKMSHNHGLASMSDDFWPYRLYQYDEATDCYLKIADVDAWDQEYYEEYNGIRFPDEADADNDGMLYYVMPDGIYDYKDPMDGETYKKWRDFYLVNTKIICISFEKMTEENIQNISATAGEIEYTDDELVQMARNYLRSKSNNLEDYEEPEYYEIESKDEIVKIWLYDIISDGEESGHGVTKGRFEIDRKTGVGEDSITFEEIDFGKYD